MGCNFTPSNAINQLEFWQAETFDPETIDRELGYAESIGMNVVRIYLHHLIPPVEMIERLGVFLGIAAEHGIRAYVTLFDDCWNPAAKLGPQPEPKPGVHNSGWLQCPGKEIAKDPSRWEGLEAYVSETIAAFASDDKVLVWDLYNEPSGPESLPLVRAAFEWARNVNPTQPLTVGPWSSNPEVDHAVCELSDVISFHNYEPIDKVKAHIENLREYGRPLICSEWLARTNQQVPEMLRLFKEEGVGAINWGLVTGKTNTKWPWGSPEGGPEPDPWFHDLFRADGSPYDPAEAEAFRVLTDR